MRSKIKALLSQKKEEIIDTEVTVKGWVKTVRDQKKFLFVEINDGSIFSNLQIIVEPTIEGYQNYINELSTGVAVSITGKVVESPGKGQNIELHAMSVEIIGKAPADTYPLQKKRHSFEFLRTIAHLRPRTNTFGAVARVRNTAAMATHQYFQEKGFLYLNTPIITSSDCEGAGELFQVSTLDKENPPRTDKGSVDYSQDFFSRPSFLTVSGQLQAEAYISALSDVYTFGPTFRAENSHTVRHLAEFWMIEPEMAFSDLSDAIDCAEGHIKHVIRHVLEACKEDMAFFNKYIEPGLIDRLQQVVDTEFERATYTYAIRILQKSGKSFEYPVEWGNDLQKEHERYLAEEHFKKPTVLTDFPRGIKAFYMRDNDDRKTVAAFDIIVPKIGEIVGGSQREERLEVLEKKIEEMGFKKEVLWWYLELRRFGSTPHSGYGLGFERCIQFLTGLENIRDVIPFPRHPGNAEF